MNRLPVAALLCVATTCLAGRARAQTTTHNPPLTWVTLGTQAGPLPNPQRSQPANLLVVNGKPWMIDCGDGAVERLAAAGFSPAQVNVAFISHLHLDHIGGLQGLIGVRWFSLRPKQPMTVYGPPGTDDVIAGILQSLGPSVRIGLGFGVHVPTPEELTRVVILKDGSDVTVDGVRVRAVRNSHFDEPLGRPANDGSQSLSYRFEYNGYAIGYTGDTGPSDAVASLEKGVDVLVSEVFDVPGMIAFMTNNTNPPDLATNEIGYDSAFRNAAPYSARGRQNRRSGWCAPPGIHSSGHPWTDERPSAESYQGGTPDIQRRSDSRP